MIHTEYISDDSTNGARPTVWRSVAASAPGDHLQKANDLAREAVNCNAVFGGNAVLTDPALNQLRRPI
jgi:hypothetical protein